MTFFLLAPSSLLNHSTYFLLPFHWPRAPHVTCIQHKCFAFSSPVLTLSSRKLSSSVAVMRKRALESRLKCLAAIILCSCVIETTLLCEKGGYVPRAGRDCFDIFRWSNDKTIIELGYRKIPWFVSGKLINYLPQHSDSANNRPFSLAHFVFPIQIMC